MPASVVLTDMTSNIIHRAEHVRFGIGMAFLFLLAGCADTPPWGSMSVVPTSAQLQAARGRQSSYVYFAAYEIYYESIGRQYTYREGDVWITRPAPPPGIPVELLETSPAVAMNFHDAPQGHHAAVVRSYPRNWGRPDAVFASAR
jgi:hypothetical protein